MKSAAKVLFFFRTYNKNDLFYVFCLRMSEISFTFAAHLEIGACVGTLPEWLGTGLQNRGQRFESARYLSEGAAG